MHNNLRGWPKKKSTFHGLIWRKICNINFWEANAQKTSSVIGNLALPYRQAPLSLPFRCLDFESCQHYNILTTPSEMLWNKSAICLPLQSEAKDKTFCNACSKSSTIEIQKWKAWVNCGNYTVKLSRTINFWCPKQSVTSVLTLIQTKFWIYLYEVKQYEWIFVLKITQIF